MNKSEGFGMVLLEANACKKPVIGSDIGGIRFVIQNNKTGLLISPNNVQSLSEAIKKILSNKILANLFGKNGYERVKTQFTWDIQVKKTNDLFKNLIVI